MEQGGMIGASRLASSRVRMLRASRMFNSRMRIMRVWQDVCVAWQALLLQGGGWRQV